MKVLSAVAVMALASVANAGYITERQYQQEFTRFVTSFDKQYTTEQFFNRYEIFKANLDLIEMHNSQPDQTSTMGVNQFSDMTNREFAAKMTGLKIKNKPRKLGKPLPAAVNPPAELDWRTKGAVTDVKDQGWCGSCWAFSATGAMEGAWHVKHGKLISLAEQQLNDCSWDYGNMGCNGGLMEWSFEYVIDNKGMCTEEEYPYKARDLECKKDCKKVVTISDYTNIDFDESHPNDDTAMMAAIQLAPFSIAIQASSSVFQGYTGGVISSAACGTDLDHGVTLVGYGTDEKYGDYWIVKNSWGKSWGAKGYVLLARGKNQCGMNMMSTYVTI